MPEDTPVGYVGERPVFDNTATVVCLIVPVDNESGAIWAIRRAKNPGMGKLGLPGGYHMWGETWQEAGAREFNEETGMILEHTSILGLKIESMVTDEFHNNLIIASAPNPAYGIPCPQDGEALELVKVSVDNIDEDDWAFPRHYQEVLFYLNWSVLGE